MIQWFQICLGSALVGYLLYRRFLRERLELEFTALMSDFILLSIIFTGILFTLAIFRVYRIMRPRQEDIAEEKPQTAWIKKLIHFAQQCSEKFTGLFEASHLLFLQSIRYQRINLIISGWLETLAIEEKVLVVVIFVFLPRLLVCSNFCLDVFYLHELKNFPHVIIFLGYPMLFRAYLGILKHIRKEILPHCESYMTITIHPDGAREYMLNYPVNEDTYEEFIAFYEVSDWPHFLCSYYFRALYLKEDVSDPFEQIIAYYGPWIILVTSSFYFFGWIYVYIYLI